MKPKKEQKPDFAANAFRVMQEATGQAPKTKPQEANQAKRNRKNAAKPSPKKGKAR